MNNNFLSEFFAMRRGVRQGDSLSPSLFILCIECLASALRNSIDFVGLTLDNSTVKASLFADDTVLCLNGSESQFKYVYKIFQNFASTSRCKINWDKSKAFNIGASKHWAQAPLSIVGLQWSNSTIRYLGLIIPTQPSSDPFELFKMNFDGYCNKIESIIEYK